MIDKLAAGDDIGTLFLPEQEQRLPAWKRWLGFTAQPSGDVLLDAGACEAVRRRGCSLLPIGVVQVQGEFAKGVIADLLANRLDLSLLVHACSTHFVRDS